jgi:hypothetical protein
MKAPNGYQEAAKYQFLLNFYLFWNTAAMRDVSKDPTISIVRANQPLIKVMFPPGYPVSYPRTATSLIVKREREKKQTRCNN